MSSRRIKFALYLILLFAIILRILAVLKYGQFWDDEIFSFIYSQKPWLDSLKFWLWETNPPAHLLFLKLWWLVFPATEFFARLPSVIFGVISVYLIYLWGRALFNERTALLAALFLALHPYHIFFSATARAYSLLILLTLLSLYLFQRIFFDEKTERKNIIAYALINFFLLLCHLTALSVVLAEGLALFTFKRQQIAAWIKINLWPCLAGGAWILSSLLAKSGNHLTQAWFLNLSYTAYDLALPLVNLITGPSLRWLVLILTITVLALIVRQAARPGTEKNFYLVLCLALIPLVTALAMGVWQIKFVFVALPALVLVAAVTLEKLHPRLAPLLIVFLCLPGLIFLWRILPLTDWDKISSYLDERRDQAKNQIFLYNNFILKNQIDRYLRPDQITKLPLLINEDTDWDRLVLKKNYLFFSYSEQEVKDWFKQNHLAEKDEIFLLQGNYGYMTNLSGALERSGWRLNEPFTKAPIMGDYWIYDYVKP